MALVVKQNKRIEHPTEPGAWAVIRVPLSVGDTAGLRVDGSQIALTLDLMAEVIQEWSYDAPVSLESVKTLDLDTFRWLSVQIMGASGIRSDEEKKDSNSDSSLTSEPAAGDSQASSGT